MKCIRFSWRLTNNYCSLQIINRSISMSQRTLRSFFKPPPKNNSNVTSAAESTRGSGSSIITSAHADSPEKVSGTRNSRRVRQLVDSDEEESVEKNHHVNGISSSRSPLQPSTLNSTDLETSQREKIADELENRKVEIIEVPRRITARKSFPIPGAAKPLPLEVKEKDDTPKVPKSESVDAEMKKTEDKTSKTEESCPKVTGKEHLETVADTNKEKDAKISTSGSSRQKEAKTDSTSKDKALAPSSKSPKNQKSDSRKRKKDDEEKSPKENAPKKTKKTGRAKKGVESDDKKIAESNASVSEEKSSTDRKGKNLIHSFFTRTSASKSDVASDSSAQEKSTSSDIKVCEPPGEPDVSKSVGTDVEMHDPEEEDSEVVEDIQKEKRKSKNSRKSSPKQKKVKAEGKTDKFSEQNSVIMPPSESPEKQEGDSEEPENSDKEKSPEKNALKKQKKRHCAKRIIESDDDEDKCSEEKDSNASEKDAADVSVEEESKCESPKKKETTQIHSFFAPKNKQEKSEKLGSPKASTSSRSEKDPVYDPTKRNYHPIDDACWKKREKVPYLALARTMEEIENISGRLKMIEMLANFFRSVIVLSPEDLLYCVYLCLNRIAPEYEGIEMGVGETLLMKAVAQATGRTLDKIKAETAVKGDLGLVAESSRGNQRYMFAPPKLTVASVFAKFKEIALMSGNAAMAKKVDKIQALFVACRQCEARYIIRSLSGKLRIGLAEQSVLAALAQAVVLTPPNQSYPPETLNSSSSMSSDSFKKKLDAQMLVLKTTYCECPNYDKIIPVLLEKGIEELPNHCYLSPGVPLKPMLAHPTKGIDEVLRRFDGANFTCEFKYDGERAQIHVLEGGEVKIYSRNQEDNTTKYPDVIARISKALKPETKSCVLDTEAVAWDRDAKQILPFQQLSTRKRKDVVESEIKVQVCIVAFDLIFLNGKSLVKLPLKERRRLLRESFIEVENEFMFVHSTDGNTAEVMQEFLEESIKGNCEGLMVKSLEVDASYEIAKRSHNWLKLKKDYLEGVGDTLDLVVIGGYHGKGKRTGAYGGFLLACYDEENEEFQTICKIGTGFKEEEFESHTSFLKEHVINEPKSYFRFDSSLTPDVWFDPVQVWEVKCADLSKSPVHKAAVGIVDPEKGISLRFPRFLKIRDDKKPEDATTAAQVARFYNSQEQIQNQKSKDSKLDDEDFY